MFFFFYLENCESGVDIYGGNFKGDCCVFLFMFNGKVYYICIFDGCERKWCLIINNYFKDKKWGFCFY